MHSSNMEAIWKQGYTTCVPSDPMYRGVPIIRYGFNWSYLVSNMSVHDLKHCRQKLPVMSSPYTYDSGSVRQQKHASAKACVCKSVRLQKRASAKACICESGRHRKRAPGVAKRPREISSDQARRQKAYFFRKM